MCLLIALPIFGYPKLLPGAEKLQLETLKINLSYRYLIYDPPHSTQLNLTPSIISRTIFCPLPTL